MDKENQLQLVARPEEYFRSLVVEALGRQQIQPLADTEFYLVQLLNRFMLTANLYATDGEGHHKEEPLAFKLKEASEQSEPKTRELLYRHIGDLSLYFSGYFRDSLQRKTVDIHYYITVGESAYQRAAEATPQQNLRPILGELAGRFTGFADVLADVGEKTQVQSEKDLLRVYEHWVNTGSDRAARTLEKAGILPVAGAGNGTHRD